MTGNSKPNTRVIVVGGGIGGITAALALRKAELDVVVLERAKALESIEVGAGVHLWSNAVRALQTVGVAGPIADAGVPVEQHRYLSWRGRPMGDLNVGRLSGSLGAPTVGLERPTLHRLLVEGLDDPGVLRLGAQCTGFEAGRRGVTARVAGGEDEVGDVLVGADGFGSVIRRQLHGASEPVYAGYTSWRAVADFDDRRIPPGQMVIYWGPGARILHYHVARDRMYWLALVKAEAGGRDPEGERRGELLRRYDGWPEPVEDLLRATDESAIMRADIVDRDPLPRWGSGRVTLLGDAAHPMTPNMAQGAGMAIEDAVCLAGALKRIADPTAALADYEQRRLERANDFVTTSRTIGKVGLMESPFMCAVRNQVVLRTIYLINGAAKAKKDLTPIL